MWIFVCKSGSEVSDLFPFMVVYLIHGLHFFFFFFFGVYACMINEVDEFMKCNMSGVHCTNNLGNDDIHV